MPTPQSQFKVTILLDEKTDIYIVKIRDNSSSPRRGVMFTFTEEDLFEMVPRQEYPMKRIRDPKPLARIEQILTESILDD